MEPLIDIFKTKRFWIYTMQFLIGGGMAGVALTIPAFHFFPLTLAFFFSFSFQFGDARHSRRRFLYAFPYRVPAVVFRRDPSTFYRIAMLAGQGFLVMLAGYFEILFGAGKTGSKGPVRAHGINLCCNHINVRTVFHIPQNNSSKPAADKSSVAGRAVSLKGNSLNPFSFFQEGKIGVI